MLFQLCAKIGGEPWALSELPFFYDCSMVLGYFVFEDIISMSVSLNQKVSRYWSKCLKINDEENIDKPRAN